MSVNDSQVKHIAALANIPTTQEESEKIAEAFTETLRVVDQLKKVDSQKTKPTYQVTGLTNILREDVARPELSFNQQAALANATKTYQGYFVVPYVLQNKDN